MNQGPTQNKSCGDSRTRPLYGAERGGAGEDIPGRGIQYIGFKVRFQVNSQHSGAGLTLDKLFPSLRLCFLTCNIREGHLAGSVGGGGGMLLLVLGSWVRVPHWVQRLV